MNSEEKHVVNTSDLILISVDDHIAEPANMFDAHVPARFKEHAPRVVTCGDGTQQWYYGDIPGRNIGLNAVAGKPPGDYNIDPAAYSDMRPGCYDVHERVRDMNAGGQVAGLNFPNWPGFSGQVLCQGPDPATNLVMVRAYNDWHVDEWCGSYPDRFIPCGILPLFDATVAASELRRLAAKGCHAVTFSENPEGLGLPSIHSGYWDPLFKAACDEGTVLCLHVGSSSRPPHTSSDVPASAVITLTAAWTMGTLAELIWSSLWFRYPTLRFALTEGDIGWIPYMLWRADQVFKQHHCWTGASFPPHAQSASEVFRAHFLACFIADPTWLGSEWLSTDQICWEADYPHSDGVWPHGPETIAGILDGQPPDLIDAVTHRNAMRAFRFDPISRRGRDGCTVASLRAQASDVQLFTPSAGRSAGTSGERWEQARSRLAGTATGNASKETA